MSKRKQSSPVSNKAASPGSATSSSSSSSSTSTTRGWLNAKKRKQSRSFSRGQQLVITRALQKKNIFFTGAAGTGKSYLLRQLVCELEKQNHMHGRVFVTAPTGLAAWHLNGTTIHSFAGIKRSDISLPDMLNEINENDHAVERWQYCSCLIIDEISMIDASFLEKLDQVARHFRQKPDLAFGGLQLIFSGDFFQLPPIDKYVDMNDLDHTSSDSTKEMRSNSSSSSSSSSTSNMNNSLDINALMAAHSNSVSMQQDKVGSSRYAFESEIWEDLFDVYIMLKDSYRHHDKSFLKLLNQIRTGKNRETTVKKIMRGAALNFDDTANNAMSKNNPPTKLFTTNALVDKENKIHLDALGDKVESQQYFATDTNKGRHQISNRQCPVPYELNLKIGASVMLLRNLDPAKGLVNGVIGTVIQFSSMTRYPVVLFTPKSPSSTIQMKNQRITVNESIWEKKSGSDIVATRTALPLRLAYALTIHKSQGQTLPRVEISFEKGTFAK